MNIIIITTRQPNIYICYSYGNYNNKIGDLEKKEIKIQGEKCRMKTMIM